jgi:quinoprotein glucose dehydrogenase
MKLFAVDAATGKQLWKFDPPTDSGKAQRTHPLRGVAYWQDGNDKRIIYGVGSSLFAVNALTGEKIKSFGINGEVDFHEGLGDEETLGHDVSKLDVRTTTPGIIYKDLFITGLQCIRIRRRTAGTYSRL